MTSSSVILPVFEDEADFNYPLAGKPLKTWYKITGELTATSIPLIVLHGGPGVGSEAYDPLTDLTSSYSIPIIQYDQVGCRNSTHIPEMATAGPEFWNERLFIAELQSLVSHLGLDKEGRQYDVIGHSWGGMFGTNFAAGRPKGLRKYVVWSSAGSMDVWNEGQRALRSTLPVDLQEKLDEEKVDVESEEYQQAMKVFLEKFVCRLSPMPAKIVAGFMENKKDPTVYSAMWGPKNFSTVGWIGNWSALDDIPKIDVPVLLLNGRYELSHDLCTISFLARLKKVKWVKFAHSAHMAHYEERERFMEVVGSFLNDA